MNEAQKNTLLLRGLSPRLLKSYLVKLNAVETMPDHFQSDVGWSVTLVARKVQLLASELDEIEVVFEGNPEIVREAIAQLRKKTLRGGG